MRYFEVLEKISVHSGLSYRALSVAMGKVPNYIAVMRNKGRCPSVDNAAKMLEVCGYGLFAMPLDKAPKDAIQITYEDKETSKE